MDIIENLIEPAHRSEWDLSTEHLGDLSLGSRRRPRRDQPFDFLAAIETIAGERIARILRQFRLPDRAHEQSPELVVRTPDRNPTVPGRKQSIGTQQRMAVALGSRRDPIIGELEHRPLAGGEHAIDHGDIDELTVSRRARPMQRRQDTERALHRRDEITDAGADFGRRPTRYRRGDCDNAAHRLGDDVVGRP